MVHIFNLHIIYIKNINKILQELVNLAERSLKSSVQNQSKAGL